MLLAQVTSSRDLLSIAYQDLPLITRESLDRSGIKKPNVVSGALQAARDQRDRFIKRCPKWKWKRPNGEEVIVRDVLENIVKWIKEVGDMAVQYDIAHAALPWAGVPFLLNALVTDFGIRAKLLYNLET